MFDLRLYLRDYYITYSVPTIYKVYEYPLDVRFVDSGASFVLMIQLNMANFA